MALIAGIALIVWGAVKIFGASSPLMPWLAMMLGFVIIIAAGSPYLPHRRPGESSSVIEERHYIGPRDQHDRNHR
ncbi:hypothetical protein [Streptomyces sp. NBC_01262]|uniref:hypothetical protein n=1 Tax=Streptomyces sp. NBC_01262 TaxID=2903803 RepID=UPI002E30A385|nr:hypothetical protein [Streptomyces sp. NBC_01262]